MDPRCLALNNKLVTLKGHSVMKNERRPKVVFDVASIPDVNMKDFVAFGMKQLRKHVDVAKAVLCHLPCREEVIENLVTALKKK